MHKIVKFLSLNNCYVIYVLLWIKYWLMWFEILLVFILFKFNLKHPNISIIRVLLFPNTLVIKKLLLWQWISCDKKHPSALNWFVYWIVGRYYILYIYIYINISICLMWAREFTDKGPTLLFICVIDAGTKGCNFCFRFIQLKKICFQRAPYFC